jgi:hypothetical protein
MKIIYFLCLLMVFYLQLSYSVILAVFISNISVPMYCFNILLLLFWKVYNYFLMFIYI